MKYILDKKDDQILSVLCNNARLSYNQLAKLTHISKDSIRARILRMQREKFILSYFPLLNYAKLGIPLFNVYCQLKSVKYISKNDIDPLIKNKNILAVTWLMGKYDLELQVMAKNKKQVKKILTESSFFKNIREYKIVVPGKPEIYSTTHLSNKTLVNSGSEKIEVLNKTDLELINLLCINAREKIIILADKLSIDESEVRYRIKNLIKRDIIWGFHAATNRTFTGLIRYLALIRVKEKFKKEEIEFLKKIDNIFYLKRCDGSWDYLLRFKAANDKGLIVNFHNLRNVFSTNLLDFKIHTILEIAKFNPKPALY